MGTLTSTIVHPRETFRRAIFLNTHSMLVAHNHPSGNPNPSQNDIAITKGLVLAGKYIGIDVVDHIIFTNEKYYSFKDAGMLQNVPDA